MNDTRIIHHTTLIYNDTQMLFMLFNPYFIHHFNRVSGPLHKNISAVRNFLHNRFQLNTYINHAFTSIMPIYIINTYISQIPLEMKEMMTSRTSWRNHLVVSYLGSPNPDQVLKLYVNENIQNLLYAKICFAWRVDSISSKRESLSARILLLLWKQSNEARVSE